MAQRVMSVEEVKRRATGPLIAGETVDLRGLTIELPLDLAGETIANVDFSGTHFRAPVSFAGAECCGLTWFRNCRFDSTVTFALALIENDCRFDGATVVGRLDFSGCELRGAAAFDNCRLQSGATFKEAVALGNLSLSRARIEGALNLQGTQCLGGLWLDDTELGAGLDGDRLEVHGRLWLRNAKGVSIKGVVAYGYVYR